MGVYIKGMDEIPEDGAVLVVMRDNGKTYIKYACTYGYSMEMVEVPEPHGRLIDADALLERACNLEAQALAYVGKIVNDESKIEEWKIWPAILAERTAFKHDVFDAPTIEPEIIRCRECRNWSECDESCLINNTVWYEADEFCSKAERKTDD